MTENDAIAKFKRTSVFWESATNTEMVEAVKVAIQALEEIQQYRVYIEIFENHFCKEALELLSDKEEFGKWLERGKWIAKRCDEVNRELVEYQTIGTVDEFKALKNKHIGKDNMVISSSDLMTILNSDSEELKKYKEVGTVEECRNVMELMKKLINRKMTVEVLENYMQFEDECVKEGYTFKSILEARKKIKPKKPIFKFEYEDGRQFYDCPVCGAYVMHVGVQSKERYCSNCGIKLDWSE